MHLFADLAVHVVAHATIHHHLAISVRLGRRRTDIAERVGQLVVQLQVAPGAGPCGGLVLPGFLALLLLLAVSRVLGSFDLPGEGREEGEGGRCCGAARDELRDILHGSNERREYSIK